MRPEDTLSDQKGLGFQRRMALSMADWNFFRRELDCPCDDLTFATLGWLDKTVEKLERDIDWALKRACPVKTSAIQPRSPTYWNSEVRDLRRACRKVWRVYDLDQIRIRVACIPVNTEGFLEWGLQSKTECLEGIHGDSVSGIPTPPMHAEPPD